MENATEDCDLLYLRKEWIAITYAVVCTSFSVSLFVAICLFIRLYLQKLSRQKYGWTFVALYLIVSGLLMSQAVYFYKIADFCVESKFKMLIILTKFCQIPIFVIDSLFSFSLLGMALNLSVAEGRFGTYNIYLLKTSIGIFLVLSMVALTGLTIYTITDGDIEISRSQSYWLVFFNFVPVGVLTILTIFAVIELRIINI
jgi:hypothetical protein